MSPTSEDKKLDNLQDSSFICGVVEGFYGRPWTTEQRKDLFTKLQAWGTNSYLYAPKDDCKHRAYWREPYTVDEAEHLGSLINLAADCNIDFYYAISPGLDITYSSPKEVSCLKRKLDQVAQLGCKAFALLFDDIEPEMSKQDKEVFQSFAHAQVSVTNDIFQHLGQPKFLFCPTQYCTARAVPTVRNSEYLTTIGSKLAPEINIMWTGDKVITKEITSESLNDINDVLKRKCVIWDNEHANDYDQKRVYLGPYSGRSPELKSKLRGVMTNPNCEYGANFVAIHTLAQWSKCSVDGTLPSTTSDTVSSDIKLENESEEGSEIVSDLCLPPNVYHPKHALIKALQAWLPEFSRQKTVWGPMSKPQVGLSQPLNLIPGVTTCMATTSTTNAGDVQLEQSVEPATTTDLDSLPASGSSLPLTPASSDAVLVTTSLKDENIDPSALQPITLPVMNSLVSTNKVVVDPSIDTDMVPEFPSDATQNPLDFIPKADIEDPPTTLPKQVQIQAQAAVLPKIVSGPNYTEPMDCVPIIPEATALETVPNELISDSIMESTPPTPMLVQDESKPESPTMIVENSDLKQSEAIVINHDQGPFIGDQGPLTAKDLLLLCQCFYLPSEHGLFGNDLLNEFYWLKRNATAMLPGSGTKDDKEEWEHRAERFNDMVKNIVGIFQKLCACQNRELVYDLYTYLWDMCGVLLTLNGFVKWLCKGSCSPKLQSYVIGQQTWFSGIREAFQSGDHEPWVFRGGLISDLLRLLPLDSGHDLYSFKYPEVPMSLLYNVRPYEAKDEAHVYALAANLYEGEIECPMGLCESDRMVVGDKYVGAFLTLCPEYCFVAESTSNGDIIAFVLSSPDATQYQQRHNVAWLPEMRLKYPRKVDDVNDAMLSPIGEMMLSFHLEEERDELPACLASVSATTTTTPSAESSGSTVPWGLFNLYISSSVVGDASVGKRLAMLCMASLRASGTLRVYTEIRTRDTRSKDLYGTMGFHAVSPHVGLLTESSGSPQPSPGSPILSSAAVPTEATANAKFSYLTRSF